LRRLTGLVLFVGICLSLIAVLRTEAVQSWIERQRQSPLPDSAATALAGSESDSVPGGAKGSRSLVVLPEDGRFAILDELTRAEESIDLYVYLLPSDEVIAELHAAHERGVTVRVILERDPFGGGNSNQEAFDRLQAEGIEVRWSQNEFRFSHIKAFVIDGTMTAIMTLNLSWTALTANREFAVISTNPTDVAEIAEVFESDWTGEGYSPSGSIVTSPDNSRAVVRELIDSARTSIEIYAEVVRDREVRDQLMAASAEGVAVRVLVPADPAPDDLLIYRELQAHGVQVRVLTVAYSHAKAIIIDRTVALVGSQNLTQTSLDDNREAGIVLDDDLNVRRLVTYFRADWYLGASVD
jgi:phosphatidylserine/phosphatidylglycerophosphate/cardiolipin synthase-like enzyme